jgi:peptidyl-prolyl cis-trans isomerase A (cyclophilin A)
MKRVVLLLALTATVLLTAQDAAPKAAPKAAAKKAAAEPAVKRDPGTYAVFQTAAGKIVCVLYEKEAPITTKNFIGLAEGTKEWTDPRTSKKMVKTALYNGTVFHRTIPNFMIQGGDPLGTGGGEPGFTIPNEMPAGIAYDKPGRLAMANRGPNTGGSQFFITDVAVGLPPSGYTIFGQVVEGLDVVSKIAHFPCKGDQPCTSANDHPVNPVKLVKVTILRVK